MRYIIFPDIHGRSFWKDAVEAYKEFDDISYIFLGDYLDPYDYEDITPEEAIANFKEILKFQIESKSPVYLLVGNHDIHYMFDNAARSSRYNYQYKDEIESVFADAMTGNNILQMDHTVEINGKIFYFSHAGVSKEWVENNKKALYANHQLEKNFDIDSWKKLPSFNYLLESPSMNKNFVDALGNISCYRWGSDPAGSMVWADWQEFLFDTAKIPGMIQIFGHTQQEYYPININNEFYCLDVRRPFILSETGNLTELDGTSIPQIDIEKYQDEQKKKLELLSHFFL